MNDALCLLRHLLTTIAKLLRPGGGHKPGPKGPSIEIIKADGERMLRKWAGMLVNALDKAHDVHLTRWDL
jgi:hypothetical protein